MIVLGIEDADEQMHYYGLPETQGFPMMFVRIDILADLGLEVPRTWDDVMSTIPTLQATADKAMRDTEFPIPTIARNDATFGSDLWRGPVWINYNYMIAEGLSNCGYKADAKYVVDKTVFHMNRWYQATGVINEFYDSANLVPPAHHNRKGLPFEPYNIDVRMQTIRDYGWSNTLLCDMLAHLA